MADFIRALGNPDISFLRYAFFVGLLASIAFGVIGTYVVARRISYIAGAISHSALGGIGIGLYLHNKVGIAGITPMHGAVVVALFAALIIGYVSLYARQREDTVIGSIWAIGMALGLLFIFKTPGYHDPMSYLFGNILLISKNDLWVVGVLDIVIVGVGILFYNKFLAVCFDEEFALIRGVRARAYYFLLLGLTALTVVLMVRIVGIVMVIALLTLPAAVAGLFSRNLWQMMIFSSLLCMLFTAVGLCISYIYDLPAGSTIIVVAGAVYLISVLLSRVFRRG